MTLAQLVSVLFDLGFGASALLLASRLTARVSSHEIRIVRLEQRVV